MAHINNRILKPFLILCEGKDVENFMICYLESSALADDPRFSNDIQTFNFGGVENLKVFIGNLTRMDRFETVHRMLVLRDAEMNVDQAIRTVQNAFQSNIMAVPDRPHEEKRIRCFDTYDGIHIVASM
ncbi:MAG: hypothetical protein IJI45_08830 [Anaerolineaceae bacterium]|nr:hypothetical protein [Anaerolineaceae bacterium]